jgi:tRNA threonylcarbamoyladenosine biosynthesis protein TsaB
MKNLIVDATRDKIFLTLIVSENIYTCTHENSKINFEKLMILINDFLKVNSSTLDQIDIIYVNRGPGSFAGIRNSLATIKALFLTKKSIIIVLVLKILKDLKKLSMKKSLVYVKNLKLKRI